MHMTNKTNASKAILLLGLLILNVCSGKKTGQFIAKVNEEKVDVKVKDEAFNNGVKGLFIVTV